MENLPRITEQKQPKKIGHGWLLGILMVASLQEPALAQDPQPDDATIAHEQIALRQLGESEVAAITEQLKTAPDREDLRGKLLAYYFMKRTTSEEAREKAQPHILWFIQNRPESKIAGSPETMILQSLDPERYEEASKAWEKQVKRHPKKAIILGNAAAFFFINDPARAEELLVKAQSLEPKNPLWSQKLGNLYSLGFGSEKAPESSAAKALKAFQRSLKGTSGEDRFYALDDTATAALEAGKTALAKEYAEELLKMAPSFSKNWNYGNAIYTANSVLGQVALASDDLSAAKAYLLAAGDTPGSPQLNSFGPDLTLATALLKWGEKEDVIAFLDKIARFWKSRATKIEEWKSAIQSGATPDFSASW